MNSRHSRAAVLLSVLLFVFVPSPGLPQDVVATECPACVFGPRVYERATSVPITEMADFVGDPEADYLIDIDNAGSQGANATVNLNGEVLLDGRQHVRRAVALRAQNTLTVRLTGKPGSSLNLRVLGGTKSVGATGGIVRAPGGGLRLDIPPEALPNDTEISVFPVSGFTPPDSLEGTEPLDVAWSLEPHGLQLARPIAASADYSAVLGQVASSDDIGVVHWDPQGTSVDVATAVDDPPTHRLSFTLDHFSLVGFVRANTTAGFSLYRMRWGISLINTSSSSVFSEFDTWGRETGGIAFTATGQPANIVIHDVTAPAPSCPTGYVELFDALSQTCLPSLTRTLGASDQVHIWLITFTNIGILNSTHAPNATVLRHAIGHALGIAHPWREPPTTTFPPLPEEVPVMAPITQSGCESFFCVPRQAWTIFSRDGLHPQDVAAIRAKYGPPAPTLLSPASGASIAQNDSSNGCALVPSSPRRGYGFKIAFDWSDVSGATQYRLVAQRQTAAIPFVDVVSPQSTYTFVSCNGFVADSNLTGWSWQVQSIANGIAGAFSAPSPFQFLPCRLPDTTPCNTGPGPYPNPLTGPTFVATLLPANTVPPISGAEASGSGGATITFDVTKDGAGNITAGTVTFVVTLTGFPPGTPITQSHIHQAFPGLNGPVMMSATLGEIITLTNGSGSFTRVNIRPDLAVLQAIINNPEGFYFDVHSLIHPGAFARGQLTKVP